MEENEERAFSWRFYSMKEKLYGELLTPDEREIARAHGIALEGECASKIYVLEFKENGKLVKEELYVGNAFEMGLIEHGFSNEHCYILGNVVILSYDRLEKLRTAVSQALAERKRSVLEKMVDSIISAREKYRERRFKDKFSRVPVEIEIALS